MLQLLQSHLRNCIQDHGIHDQQGSKTSCAVWQLLSFPCFEVLKFKRCGKSIQQRLLRRDCHRSHGSDDIWNALRCETVKIFRIFLRFLYEIFCCIRSSIHESFLLGKSMSQRCQAPCAVGQVLGSKFSNWPSKVEKLKDMMVLYGEVCLWFLPFCWQERNKNILFLVFKVRIS